MKHYTAHTDYESIHITSVTSLDPSLVQMKLSMVIPQYRKVYTDVSLHMYAALFLSGTQKYSKEALDYYLKQHGISLKISVHNDIITISIVVRKQNLPRALLILKELLLNPKLDTKEFTRKQILFLEENREDHDNAKKIAHINFLNLLFPPGSSLRSRTLKEDKNDIQQLNTNKYSLLAQNVLKGEWYVTVVGDKESASLVTEKMVTLGSLTTQVDRSEVPITPPHRSSHFEVVKGKTNVEVRMGALLALTPEDSDFLPLSFGIDVLGLLGGFSGRLMSTVREKHGLTYGIYATPVIRDERTQAHWNVYTFFSAKDFNKGIIETNKEIVTIVKNGISIEELSIFKEIKKNRFALAHDSNAHRLALYHNARIMGYTESDLLILESKRELLSCEEVNTAVKKHIDPRDLTLSAAGPISKEGIPITPATH